MCNGGVEGVGINGRDSDGGGSNAVCVASIDAANAVCAAQLL